MTNGRNGVFRVCKKTECPVNIEFTRHLLQSVGELYLPPEKPVYWVLQP